jgi:HTH domain
MPRQSKYIVPEDVFIQAVKESFSIAEALRKMGCPVRWGGAYKQFHIRVKQLQLDTSHFTGAGHLKGKTHNWSKRAPLEELLIQGSNLILTVRHKRYIIEAGLLENKCVICQLTGTWQDKPINLQMDHINGDPFDHRIENLRLLCPNCHSQTDTFCARNKEPGAGRSSKNQDEVKFVRTKKIWECILCHNECKDGAKYCNACWRSRRKELQTYTQPDKIVWPSLEELLLRLETMSYLQLAKELGVSDNAIRKRIKKLQKQAA